MAAKFLLLFSLFSEWGSSYLYNSLNLLSIIRIKGPATGVKAPSLHLLILTFSFILNFCFLGRKSGGTTILVWIWCKDSMLYVIYLIFSSLQFSHSLVSDSLRLHVPKHARPPCPLLTPRLIQTHVHWVGDAIQPSHPLSSPSPPALNLSQHQGLFQWVSSSHQVASVRASASALVLPMNTQVWFPLGWTGWISLQYRGFSRAFSNTTVQKHPFFYVKLYSPALTSIHDHWKNHSLD